MSQRTAALVRPIYLALIMALAAEGLIFVVWGLLLSPAGELLAKARWALFCGLGMGLAIGLLVSLMLAIGLRQRAAFWGGAAVCYAVLASCTLLCLFLDQPHDLWGGASRPFLFAIFGLLPALKFSLLYAWLLFTERGASALDRARSRLVPTVR